MFRTSGKSDDNIKVRWGLNWPHFLFFKNFLGFNTFLIIAKYNEGTKAKAKTKFHK